MTAFINKNILLNCCIAILLLVGMFGMINSTFAQNSILNDTSGSQYSCGSCNGEQACKQYCGDYELNDFARIAIRVSQIIIGVSGSLALLAFVYGGVMFLISAGNKETVEKAKRIITGAVIGLIIVFASWAIINLIITSLGYTMGTPWNQIK